MVRDGDLSAAAAAAAAAADPKDRHETSAGSQRVFLRLDLERVGQAGWFLLKPQALKEGWGLPAPTIPTTQRLSNPQHLDLSVLDSKMGPNARELGRSGTGGLWDVGPELKRLKIRPEIYLLL